MNLYREWVNWATLLIITGVLALVTSCAASPVKPSSDITYKFCKAGIGGDWRLGEGTDPSTGEKQSILFLFSVGGPYDEAHLLCAISGDHAILDLGVGKQS